MRYDSMLISSFELYWKFIDSELYFLYAKIHRYVYCSMENVSHVINIKLLLMEVCIELLGNISEINYIFQSNYYNYLEKCILSMVQERK